MANLEHCPICNDLYECNSHNYNPTCFKDECYEEALKRGIIGKIVTNDPKYNGQATIKINEHRFKGN